MLNINVFIRYYSLCDCSLLIRIDFSRYYSHALYIKLYKDLQTHTKTLHIQFFLQNNFTYYTILVKYLTY